MLPSSPTFPRPTVGLMVRQVSDESGKRPIAGRAEGQTVVEYALIVAVVSIGVGVAIIGFGEYLLDAAREGASALIG